MIDFFCYERTDTACCPCWPCFWLWSWEPPTSTLALKVGMTVSASIPASVMAMLILRGLFRSGTILEANQVQTAASAGESLAAGIIFTMPALLLIGAWQHFDLLLTTLIAFTGGVLGVLFMIPMRRVLVVDPNSELKFPEGLACASVLKAGDSAGSEARGVVLGAVLGGVFKALGSFFGILKGVLEQGRSRPGGSYLLLWRRYFSNAAGGSVSSSASILPC